MRKVNVHMHDTLAGVLTEDDEGYHFEYDSQYLVYQDKEPISLTLPITEVKYTSKILFPFFDGLIPEGWLLDIAEKNWKLDLRDRMGILMVTCSDCIGAVSIQEIKE